MADPNYKQENQYFNINISYYMTKSMLTPYNHTYTVCAC